MRIDIDDDKCTGCGICVDACSPDVLRMDSETDKVGVKYPDDCIGCFECELDCPAGAINVHPLR